MSYDAARAQAERMIRRKGAAVTWRRPGARTVTAGVESTGSATTATVEVVVLPISDRNDQRFSPESLVRGAAYELLLSGTAANAPRAGDEFDLPDGTVKVKSLTTLAPGGVPVLYTLAAER